MAVINGRRLAVVGIGCVALWYSIRGSVNSDESTNSLRSVAGGSTSNGCYPKTVLDYFEVGTSDFHTQVQAAYDEYKSSGKVLHGVSVDAMKIYIDRLSKQAGPGAVLMNSAVVGYSPHDPTITTYYIHPDDIAKYNLPDWLRGCNSVGKPHPLHIGELTKAGHMELLHEVQVPLNSIAELMLMHNACRIKVLKIDVEGLDSSLLLNYVDFLWRHPYCWADQVEFEDSWMPKEHWPAVHRALASVGYAEAPQRVEHGPVWLYNAGIDSRLVFAGRAALEGFRGRRPTGPQQVVQQTNTQKQVPTGASSLSESVLKALLVDGLGSEDDLLHRLRQDAAWLLGPQYRGEAECPWK